MSTIARPHTATIYQFPVRPREARPDATPPSPWRDAASREDFTPRADFMSGWYHEAAIRETDRSRDH